MTVAEFISSDLYSYLKRHGFISYKLGMYYEIHDKRRQLLASGMPKTKVVRAISESLGVHRNTIYQALRSFPPSLADG